LIIHTDGSNFEKPISGVGRSIIELIRYSKNKFIILINKRLHKDYIEIKKFKNVKLIKNIYFKNLYCKNQDIRVYLATCHKIPLNLNHNVMVIMIVHDLVWKIHPETMKFKGLISEKLFFNRTIKRANLIFCPSNSISKQLNKYYPKFKKKINILPWGVKDFKYQIEIKSSNRFFLNVGTFEPRKNLFNLIKAFELIKNSRPHLLIKLIIAGGVGWGNLNIQKLIYKLNLNNMIEVIRSPSDKKLYELYHNCEALIFPSVYEGFGLPLIEALALKKPVLISNIEVFKEIAKKNALYFDPHNAKSIKNKILKIYMNKNLQTKIINNIRKENILDKYSWKKTSLIFDDLVLSLQNVT